MSRSDPDSALKHVVHSSPVGELTLVATGNELSGVYLLEQRHRPVDTVFGIQDHRAFDETRRQLDEYFAGTRRCFDLLLRFNGTSFQQTVWQALRDIPYGETRSYGELARAISRPGAARAVGLANGKNPLSIVVPCHRVLGANGALVGYGGGVQRKRYLLDLERDA